MGPDDDGRDDVEAGGCGGGRLLPDVTPGGVVRKPKGMGGGKDGDVRMGGVGGMVCGGVDMPKSMGVLLDMRFMP